MHKLLITSLNLLFIFSSCDQEKSGCTDINACNFDPVATSDEGNCQYVQTWYADPDGDGLGDPNSSQITCTKPDGYVNNDDDTVALTPTQTPTTPTITSTPSNPTTTIPSTPTPTPTIVNINGCMDALACNYDTSATSDDGTCQYAQTWYADPDGNGKGNPDDSLIACTQPNDYVSNSDDVAGCMIISACNYNPNATIDDGSCQQAPTWYSDADNDGMGNPNESLISCTQPNGYVNNADDIGLPAGPSSDRQTKRPIGTPYGGQGFWEYLPVGYGNGDKWPLLIFYHGLGENGSGNDADLNKVLAHGPPSLINNNQWPVESGPGPHAGDAFIVLSVQNSRSVCHESQDVNAFMRWAIEEYDVDITRIYLTGLSCGAYGVWDYLRDYLNDDLVAATVPIAGDGQSAWATHGCNLGVMPIWAFHGGSDGTVTPNGTHVPMDGLAACSDPAPIDAEKTIYPGVGHNSWSQTYDLSAGHDIYSWLLAHTNPDANP